ncbi:TetR/AcrR family transcriptional regulator [Enterovibrio coralii]|uniref:TetR family transcriptional regulator n=1 Tax=Enterovibrio coralii TaxID=294935 RepID=A0A135IC89_9GAMM|nr:TetR/AcrR family transcriptional regulator [Enterovibrio coralii]KXF83082.1 TetR family transcriptional regulator [Enterovibrio coralii]
MQERRQGRRSAETAEQTKHEIMHVAADMFAELGFERVSLRNISEKAGVSHSLIRHHFGSKEQIWKSISDAMDEYMQSYITLLIEKMPNDTSSAERIYHFLVKMLAFTLLNPRPIQFIADAVRQGDDSLLTYFLGSKEEFASVFGVLFDDYNAEHPEKPVHMWEMKWQLLQCSHAATSLRPIMFETWPESADKTDILLLNHWKLFNRSMAMQLDIKPEQMLAPEKLEDLVLDLPCCV